MSTENLIKRLSRQAEVLLKDPGFEGKKLFSHMLQVMQAIQADRKAVIAHNKKLQKQIDRLKAKHKTS